MWQSRRGRLDRGESVSVLVGAAALSFADALEAIRGEAAFRTFLLAELRNAPFPAIFWETPPITRETLGRPFEYVTIAAPHLGAVKANRRPFARQFAGAG